jgi:hypothetical protein
MTATRIEGYLVLQAMAPHIAGLQATGDSKHVHP